MRDWKFEQDVQSENLRRQALENQMRANAQFKGLTITNLKKNRTKDFNQGYFIGVVIGFCLGVILTILLWHS